MSPLACAVIAYLIASAWESIGHRMILHAKPKVVMRWHRLGQLGRAMREARFNHLIHHRLTAAGPWTRQRILSSLALSDGVIQQLVETGFGESINPSLGACILFSGVPLALTVPLYLAVAPAWLPLGVVLAMAPYLMTRYVHPFLHDDKGDCNTRSGLMSRPAFQRMLASLKAYHAQHHRNPATHFNLLPGADSLFGTFDGENGKPCNSPRPQ